VSDERRIWLVRHGETEGQSSIRFHGSNDVELSEAGRRQVRALVPWLAKVPFARVVHSPLSRAAESAAILVDGCGLGRDLLAADERLREICFGSCEGLTRAEIELRHPSFFADYEAGRVDSFPGGEPRAAFAARVAAAVQEFVTAPFGAGAAGDLLVVGHRGTVRHTLRTLLAWPDGSADPFAVELASLTVLRDDGGWQLDLLSALP
jgi:probable phosphoglycerate mutase